MLADNKKTLLIFGSYLKEVRKIQGLSQEELAEKVGVHRTYVGMIERGEKNITLLNILKISKALNIPPQNLLMRYNDG